MVDKKGMMLRLAVITPQPTPYRDPFWAEVARRPGVELLVCYLTRESRDRPWQVTWPREFPFRELAGINLLGWRGPTEACYWNPEVRRLVHPDTCDAVILGGYNHPTLLWAMWRARRLRIPFFVMSESHLRNPRARWKSAIKRPLLRWIVRNAAGLFPTGRLAQEYFEHYGALPEQCVRIPNVPDVVRLMQFTEEQLSRRNAIRGELGFGTERVILFVGRLIPKKGVHTLIRACSLLPREVDYRLIIVGHGTFGPELEKLARKLGIAERVQFVGFVQPEKLPKWYLAADVFVLPSLETWGVVALEALACGLPVILSDQTGCWPDVLPEEEQARCVFPFGDAEALADRLRIWLCAPLDRKLLLKNRALHLQRFHYDTLATRLVKFISARGTCQKLATPYVESAAAS
ncbi:MAG: glycosyltransferase family 4 protein [Thermogutta sp.]